jgi:hypothetical protein
MGAATAPLPRWGATRHEGKAGIMAGAAREITSWGTTRTFLEVGT